MTRVIIELDGQTCTIEREDDEMTAVDLIESMIIPAMIGVSFASETIRFAIAEIAEEITEQYGRSQADLLIDEARAYNAKMREEI